MLPERPQAAPILEVEAVVHRYGSVVALNGVSIRVARGEFLTLLGSSGSGKSTLLRIVAGLEMPTSIARLAISGNDVASVPANHRNVSTVFQHYGLFPHMTVGQNVEYGLKVRKVPPAQRRDSAERMLDLVKLSGFYARGVQQLSGGQKQRVALARSLVLNPDILLLDEPLGALDEKLRVDMQVELLLIQRRLGMTFIYVTHSQEEALTMSDRILLMSQGQIVQEGAPVDLFDRPNSLFTAQFMGMENVFQGRIAAVSGKLVEIDLPDAKLRGQWTADTAPAVGAAAVVAVRAEKVRPIAKGAGLSGPNMLEARLLNRAYKGKYLDVSASSPAGELRMKLWDNVDLDEVFRVQMDESDLIVVPKPH